MFNFNKKSENDKPKLIDGASNFKIVKETKKSNPFFKIAICILFLLLIGMIASLYFILPTVSTKPRNDVRIDTPSQNYTKDYEDISDVNKITENQKKLEEEQQQVDEVQQTEPIQTIKYNFNVDQTRQQSYSSTNSSSYSTKEDRNNAFWGTNKKKQTTPAEVQNSSEMNSNDSVPQNNYSQTQSSQESEQEVYNF